MLTHRIGIGHEARGEEFAEDGVFVVEPLLEDIDHRMKKCGRFWIAPVIDTAREPATEHDPGNVFGIGGGIGKRGRGPLAVAEKREGTRDARGLDHRAQVGDPGFKRQVVACFAL